MLAFDQQRVSAGSGQNHGTEVTEIIREENVSVRINAAPKAVRKPAGTDVIEVDLRPGSGSEAVCVGFIRRIQCARDRRPERDRGCGAKIDETELKSTCSITDPNNGQRIISRDEIQD